MKEIDLLQLLTFIAEEDGQISTVTNFFSKNLGYEVLELKNIIQYGVENNIFKIVEYNKEIDKMIDVDELSKIDWSISNSEQEIYFNDFEHYRNVLFVSNPKLPKEFSDLVG